MTDATKKVSAALVVYVALSMVAAQLLSDSAYEIAYSESGVFEQLAMWGWLALAIMFIVRPLPKKSTTLLVIFLCLAAFAREADWHKAFTEQSIFKLRYYANPAAPIVERLLAGTFYITLLIIVAITLFRSLRYFREHGLRATPNQVLLLAFVILVLSKTLDRTPAVIEEWWPVKVPVIMRRHTQALEEGLEAAVPVLLFIAALAARRATGLRHSVGSMATHGDVSAAILYREQKSAKDAERRGPV